MTTLGNLNYPTRLDVLLSTSTPLSLILLQVATYMPSFRDAPVDFKEVEIFGKEKTFTHCMRKKKKKKKKKPKKKKTHPSAIINENNENNE